MEYCSVSYICLLTLSSVPFFPFFVCYLAETVPIRTAPPQGQPLPPDYGPPPYEAPQPGFLPPHVPGEGPMPMPMPMPPPPQGTADSQHILSNTSNIRTS